MSDTPIAPLPPSYDWGFVVGRSISAMADTIYDLDRFPEARGSTGRVTFTPHTRYKKELSAPTAFVHFEVITARIENGNVVDAQGEDGIYLISGAYKVAFTIDSGSIPGFDILVTPNHTLNNPLDLVTAAPFVPEEGTPVTTVTIPAGAAEDQVLAWRNDRLVWVNIPAEAEAAAARAEAAASSASSAAADAASSVDELTDELKPEFTWSGTNLVIDGVPGPDLKGERGDGPPWERTSPLTTEDNLDTLPSGAYRVASSTVASALGFPTPNSGELVMYKPYGSAGAVGRAIWLPTNRDQTWETRKHGGDWLPWRLTDWSDAIAALEYDTGWRSFTPVGPHLTGDGEILFRRIGDAVYCRFNAVGIESSIGNFAYLNDPGFIPVGFRPEYGGRPMAVMSNLNANPSYIVGIAQGSRFRFQTSIPEGMFPGTGSQAVVGQMSWSTLEARPSLDTLPGDPA